MEATRRCQLPRLPADPTQADYERVFNARGVVILLCDGRRQLAVDTVTEEHRLQDLFARAQVDRRRTLWERVTPWTEDAE